MGCADPDDPRFGGAVLASIGVLGVTLVGLLSLGSALPRMRAPRLWRSRVPVGRPASPGSLLRLRLLRSVIDLHSGAKVVDGAHAQLRLFVDGDGHVTGTFADRRMTPPVETPVDAWLLTHYSLGRAPGVYGRVGDYPLALRAEAATGSVGRRLLTFREKLQTPPGVVFALGMAAVVAAVAVPVALGVAPALALLSSWPLPALAPGLLLTVVWGWCTFSKAFVRDLRVFGFFSTLLALVPGMVFVFASTAIIQGADACGTPAELASFECGAPGSFEVGCAISTTATGPAADNCTAVSTWCVTTDATVDVDDFEAVAPVALYAMAGLTTGAFMLLGALPFELGAEDYAPEPRLAYQAMRAMPEHAALLLEVARKLGTDSGADLDAAEVVIEIPDVVPVG